MTAVLDRPTGTDAEFAHIVGGLTRRGLLAGGLGSAALFGLAACDPAHPVSSAAGGRSAGPGFDWTDARGRRIDLAGRPQRVVAQGSAAASLLDAGFRVSGVYGELGKTDGKLNYQAGGIDPSRLTVIGSTYGEFNVEKYASIRPDLLIDLCFDGRTLWYVPVNDAQQVEAIAPTLGVRMLDYDLPQLIDEFMRLAAALGADTSSAEVARAKTAYDTAVAQVKAAAAANPGLRVLVMSGSEQTAYLADSSRGPELAQLASLGVRITDVKAPGTDDFLSVSWEQIGNYPADLILYDARVPAPTTIATWNRLPAVRARQVHQWYPAAPYSYRAYGPIYQQLAGWLRSARIVTQL